MSVKPPEPFEFYFCNSLKVTQVKENRAVGLFLYGGDNSGSQVGWNASTNR